MFREDNVINKKINSGVKSDQKESLHELQNKIQLIKGFSKLSKEDKLEKVTQHLSNPEETVKALKSFWHSDPGKQKRFDEFSENTISNFFFPFGVAPNMVINGRNYIIPMVIEESSVVAAASSSAKYWSDKGGFHTRIIDTKKVGQVHFVYKGSYEKLKAHMPSIRARMIEDTDNITVNMNRRGGGILDIELVSMTHELENYYQIKATFETVDSMGANFINSCLEEFAETLRSYISSSNDFEEDEKDVRIIMSILSNYTPDCIVEAWVESDIEDLVIPGEDMTPEEFVWKFQQAVKIAEIDVHRATTHNKGVFNGIDAVILATGNDFRAVEACGHTYAGKDGRYSSLTKVEIKDGKFRYSLKIPLALGTVGGLTTLHPMAKFSLELLGNPTARELMSIAASIGLANNFAAIKSLVTKGIQHGHMKMHLLNILNHFGASVDEKKGAVQFFKDKKVSFARVAEYLANRRS